MFYLLARMTSISWLVTSLLLSVLVGLTIGCNKLSNGNWMKKMGDVRTSDGWYKRPDRTQGSRMAHVAEVSKRNRRNQADPMENDYESAFSSSLDQNAINSEQQSVLTPQEIFDRTDIDGDGVVTETEYREMNPDMDDMGVKHVFLAYDRNRDGDITRAEFLGLPEPLPIRSCEEHLMKVCDYQFINATQMVHEDPSRGTVCDSFQVYVDCLARENEICQAELFTQKIFSIASGLRDDGECPDLQLAALRYPDVLMPRPELPFPGTGGIDQQQPLTGRNLNDQPPRSHAVDIMAEAPVPMYGSGSKQEDNDEEDYKYGHLFDVFDAMMLADEETGIGSSSSIYTVDEYSKGSKSNHDRKYTNRDSVGRDRTESHKNEGLELYDNGNYHNTEVTTITANDEPQLQYNERELFKTDNVQSVTSSWKSSTEKSTSPRLGHHHRHHHTSRTQSTEQLEKLNIRQVRSSTTKKRPIEKSRNRSRGSNCAVSTIAPCNQAFISALAMGEEDPCESLVKFRHCVHKSTRHCMDTNVFKIREGLKYLSKEHRRAKLCRQITP